MSRKIPSGAVPQSSTPKPEKQINRPVSISFRFIETGGQHCLSHCKQDDVREMCDCLRQLTTLSWSNVMATGGKGSNKAGLGYTPYEDNTLRGVSRPPQLSEDITIVGVRASQRMRIFGGYFDHVFYVLWFDKDHAIVRG